MSILTDRDKYRSYNYRITELYLFIQGEKEEQIPPERISKMTIIHDYEKNIFPIFKISIVLESDLYYKIIKNKNTAQFKIRIQKFYRLVGSEEKSLLSDYVNGVYDLILDDDDYDRDEAIKREKNSNDFKHVTSSNENELFDVDNSIDLFLFRSDIIKKSKKNINKILKNATVTDAVALFASTVGLQNILMSPSENTKVYDELVIPRMEMFKAIQFLDTYYGFYKKGSIIYFDFDIVYILSYVGNCTAYQKKEPQDTVIIIPEKSQTYSSDSCSMKRIKDNTNYIICNSTDFAVRNESISFDAYASNDATFVDSYNGDIDTSNSAAEKKGSETNVRVFENTTENKWMSKIYASQTEAKSVVIETELSNYDISVLAPNKRFKFLFEDAKMMKKYKGIYQIASISHNFIKNGTDFKIMSNVVFRRV